MKPANNRIRAIAIALAVVGVVLVTFVVVATVATVQHQRQGEASPMLPQNSSNNDMPQNAGASGQDTLQ